MFRKPRILSFDNAVVTENFSNCFECVLYLLCGVCGHQREADKGVLGRYCRRYHRVDEDTLFKKVAGDGESLEVVADKERYDRS